MIHRLVLGSISGAAIGFVFGIYYAHASHGRMEAESAACRTLSPDGTTARRSPTSPALHPTLIPKTVLKGSPQTAH